jgi:hypothetical protein
VFQTHADGAAHTGAVNDRPAFTSGTRNGVAPDGIGSGGGRTTLANSRTTSEVAYDVPRQRLATQSF